MAKQNKISLFGLTVYAIVVGALLLGIGTLTSVVLSQTSLSPELIMITAAFNSATVVIALTIMLEMRLSGGTLREALQAVGIKPGTGPQVKIAILGLGPLALAYLMIFAALEIPADTVSGMGWVLTKFLIIQGIAQEIVFRGFVFRHLRYTQSFVRAATISGALFALINLANFAQGFNLQMLMAVGLSILFGFVLTYPLSRLFELGLGSIVGGTILHLGLDSINWFAQAAAGGVGLITYLLGVLGTAIAVMLMCRPRLRT